MKNLARIVVAIGIALTVLAGAYKDPQRQRMAFCCPGYPPPDCPPACESQLLPAAGSLSN